MIESLQYNLDSHRHRRSRIITAFLHDQTITQDVYEEELTSVTAEIADTQAEISRLRDQDLDIALVCSFAPAYVFPGIGDGTFSTPYQITSVDTWSVISEDFDLDGDYDLVFCEGSYFQQYHVRCYRNTTISQGCEEGVSSNASLSISPNPFSSSLSINFNLPEPTQIELSVYDLTGRLVGNLESGSVTGGEHTRVWDPDPALPDGVYLIVLDACGKRAVRRCVKLD